MDSVTLVRIIAGGLALAVLTVIILRRRRKAVE
jgi:LPXTG-motif cell wall-anchored protein